MTLDKKRIKLLRDTPLEGRNKLYDAMRLARITQVQLGEQTGLGQSRISEIVNGRYMRSGLPLEQARVIADVLGVEIDDVFPREASVA